MTFKSGDWVRTKPMHVKSIDINNDVWVRDWDNKERRWSADEIELIAMLPEVKICECCRQVVKGKE